MLVASAAAAAAAFAAEVLGQTPGTNTDDSPTSPYVVTSSSMKVSLIHLGPILLLLDSLRLLLSLFIYCRLHILSETTPQTNTSNLIYLNRRRARTRLRSSELTNRTG